VYLIQRAGQSKEKKEAIRPGVTMLIYDDLYHWQGWGGKLKLGSGKCRLRIFDLKKGSESKDLTFLRPVIVLVTDVPESKMTVRSCASHIATGVVSDFNIDPGRMLWIEHYPEKSYGIQEVRRIPESYEVVEFTWYEDKAIHPKWRTLTPPMRTALEDLLKHP